MAMFLLLTPLFFMLLKARFYGDVATGEFLLCMALASMAISATGAVWWIAWVAGGNKYSKTLWWTGTDIVCACVSSLSGDLKMCGDAGDKATADCPEVGRTVKEVPQLLRTF